MSAGQISGKSLNVSQVCVNGVVAKPNQVYSGLATIPLNASVVPYYILIPTGYITNANAPVSVQLQVPDGATANWIVDARPVVSSGGVWYIRVDLYSAVSSSLTTVSWMVGAPVATPTTATITLP